MGEALQLCYVLVCTGWGVHAHRTFVSCAAARAFHPEARCILLVDFATNDMLRREAQALLDMFHRVVVLETNAETPIERHRSLKLRMRQSVRGDFVYLDSDALPVAPFADILEFDAPLGAVLDFNRCLAHQAAIPQWIQRSTRC
jgi:hypothetical protein